MTRRTIIILLVLISGCLKATFRYQTTPKSTPYPYVTQQALDDVHARFAIARASTYNR